jgi:cytochrome c556
MIKSCNLMVLVLSLAFVMAPLGTSDTLAHSGVLNKDVAARMTLMSSMGRNMGVLGKMLQKKAPFDQGKAVEAINNIEQLAVETPLVFEKRVLDPRSEAKELIWEEFKSFTKISTGLATSAKQLSSSMKSFDDLRPALITLSQSCKECHSRFRE